MADVILGRAGSTVLVDLDICVKTGGTTRQRVTLRGSTTPAWVTLLLLFSIVGFLIASSMTSHRYRVTLPFTHAVHDRWSSNRRLGWLVGLAGAGALALAVTIGDRFSGVLVGIGLVLLAGGAAIVISNSLRNNVGIRMTRRGDLVVTRAHPLFVEAVRAAVTEPLNSR